jgi:uncharacterized membrane protein
MAGPTRGWSPRSWLPAWRREELRTTLWLVPSLLSIGAAALFAVTYSLDRAVYRGDFTLPTWMDEGSADAGREVLSAIAAGVITVAGVVFSVTIVVLTLASQQFGPRMLRNFVRDLGTQISLGAYVATFVYAVLALGAISGSGARPFVPSISIAVCLALLLIDVVVLIYFIHHIAVAIQLPQVMAGISRDLHAAIDAQFPISATGGEGEGSAGEPSLEIADVLAHIEREGSTIRAASSGYLQYVRYQHLTAIATANDSVIELLYRTGHFVTAGLPLARVWPAEAAGAVSADLEQAHIAGSYRTLSQDAVFAIDQLVEIAIRALSPAVNDTFTALTCIDWLADGLCVITGRRLPDGVHRDHRSAVRVIEPPISYARMVNRSCDKIRQAGIGMPAVLIRQIDSVGKVLSTARTDSQRAVLMRQAEMIHKAGGDRIAEPNDRDDLDRRYQGLVKRYSAG